MGFRLVCFRYAKRPEPPENLDKKLARLALKSWGEHYDLSATAPQPRTGLPSLNLSPLRRKSSNPKLDERVASGAD